MFLSLLTFSVLLSLGLGSRRGSVCSPVLFLVCLRHQCHSRRLVSPRSVDLLSPHFEDLELLFSTDFPPLALARLSDIGEGHLLARILSLPLSFPPCYLSLPYIPPFSPFSFLLSFFSLSVFNGGGVARKVPFELEISQIFFFSRG